MLKQASLDHANRTLSNEVTTCVQCSKEYNTNRALFTSEPIDGIKEVTLDCPHCKFSFHVFYTSTGFELRAARLKVLFEKYRQSRRQTDLLNAKTAQGAYQKDFARFNQRMIDKLHPMTKERFLREKQHAQ